MQVLTLVLIDDAKLDTLLTKLYAAGIRGGTILESTGMTHTILNHDDDMQQHFGMLRKLLNPDRARSKTMFFVAREAEIKKIEEIVLEVVGDMSAPDTGFMFVQEVVRSTGGSFDSFKD